MLKQYAGSSFDFSLDDICLGIDSDPNINVYQGYFLRVKALYNLNVQIFQNFNLKYLKSQP